MLGLLYALQSPYETCHAERGSSAMNRKERRAASKRDQRSAVSGSAPARSRDPDQQVAEARRHYDEGRLAPARTILQDTLARNSAHLASLNLLGLIEQSSGRHAAAVRLIKKAIHGDPYNAASHYNIGLSYQAMDMRAEAASHFREAIALKLSGKGIGDFILQNPAVITCLERIAAMWPARPTMATLFGATGIDPVAQDVFLCSALEATRLHGPALETFLTELRYALLQLAVGGAPGFADIPDTATGLCSALAQQCFINEYIFAQGDDEAGQADGLSDLLQTRLGATGEVPPFLLAIVAAYRPLCALPGADALLERRWPAVIDGLLRQQVREPREEMQDRASIPAVTAIADGVSTQVRQQYEENPYPRWTIVPRRVPPLADRPDGTGDAPPRDILVAGCGTGRNAIMTAQSHPNAGILAVDISLSSLAYARRKTREAGLRSIDYAHADITELRSIERRFDHIEAIGVLHHLADPKEGWRILKSLLRPGGLMVIGLYSAIARRGINAARAFVKERGYQATAGDIRACRQELIRRESDMLHPELTDIADFYSMSECRDLLFHVMEHQFTIPDIKAFLADEGLVFVGFELDDTVADKFQEQYPGDDALADLDRWQAFEAANPRTFIEMYVLHARSDA
jgi:SAM-dependent methyltransferase/tetratricopeptide (TPR) repeat protein